MRLPEEKIKQAILHPEADTSTWAMTQGSCSSENRKRNPGSGNHEEETKETEV